MNTGDRNDPSQNNHEYTSGKAERAYADTSLHGEYWDGLSELWRFFCDIDGKTVFNLIEEWETREDLGRHIGSERFSVLLGTKSLLAKPLEINIHTVSLSEGAEVVNALRGRGTSKKNV